MKYSIWASDLNIFVWNLNVSPKAACSCPSKFSLIKTKVVE